MRKFKEGSIWLIGEAAGYNYNYKMIVKVSGLVDQDDDVEVIIIKIIRNNLVGELGKLVPGDRVWCEPNSLDRPVKGKLVKVLYE